MAIQFPTSPSDGQTYTYEGITFVFDAADTRWTGQFTAADFEALAPTVLAAGTLPTDVAVPSANLVGAVPAIDGSMLTGLAGGGGAPAGVVSNSRTVTNSNAPLTTTIPANSGWLRFNIAGANNANILRTSSVSVARGSGTSDTVVFPRSGDNDDSYPGVVYYAYWA